MKINKISSKLIKPHTPTPQKSYKISFLDKHMGPMNIGFLLFYQFKPVNCSHLLQHSLAKILVQFYPLAGRYIKSDAAVDCSDQGAEFVEAEALDVELLDLVAKAEIEQLVPDQYLKTDEAADDPLLSILLTHFPCGGLVIGISISHRVFDGTSFATFLAAWSNATNPDTKKFGGIGIAPSFELSSLLPYKHHDFSSDVPTPKKPQSSRTTEVDDDDDDRFVLRRLLFDKASLTSLKSKVVRPNSNGKTVSGVRVVCAVIAKALIRADRLKQGKTRDFIVLQAVDLRGKTLVRPQPKHACGNLWLGSATRRVDASEAEVIGVQGLVDLLDEGARKCVSDHAEILSPDKDGRDIIINTMSNLIKQVLFDPEAHVVVFSDCSKFGFYEADFGWGKPFWTSVGPKWPRKSTTILMSTKEGGIEAYVQLDKNDMFYFERDDQIKPFIITTRVGPEGRRGGATALSSKL